MAWTHWPALSARAISFDDRQYLTQNVLVQTPGWRSAKRFVTEVLTPSTVAGYYQPLTMISLMLDYAVAGRPDNLRPFHRTSLALHVINTMLIVILLHQLFGNIWAAAMVGLLFGVHPLTVEPIPWIGERKTLLAAFFALLAMMAYLRYCGLRIGDPNPARKCGAGPGTGVPGSDSPWKSKTWYAVSVVCFVLALLSKPTSIPLPFLLLLLDYWPLRRWCTRALIEKVPLLAIAAVFAVITYVSQERTGGVTDPGEHSALHVPLILCHNIIFYLYKMVWPANLSSHYPFPVPLTLSEPMVLGGVVGTCVLIPMLLISLRATRALLTGWLFFFVAIFPTLGVIGFTNVIAADKYVYLPVFGILMILAWGLGQLRIANCGLRNGEPESVARKSRAPNRSVVVVVVVVVLVLAAAEAGATRRQLARWQDTETLFRHMLKLAPNEGLLHNGLGLALADAGHIDEAIAEYKRALELKPESADVHNNLGAALVSQGKIDDAIAHYRRALELRPDFVRAHYNLGLALAAQGRGDEAVGHYRRALELNPDCVEAYNNLGLELAAHGRIDEAIAHYRRALDVKPDYMEAHYNLAAAYMSRGRLDEAIKHYRRALEVKPESVEARINLGLALAGRGQLNEAVAEYEQALRLNPASFEAHNNLGLALADLGRLDEAVSQYRSALQLRPDYSNVHKNLGLALSKQGRTDEAIAEFRKALRINPQDEGARQTLEALTRTGGTPAPQ